MDAFFAAVYRRFLGLLHALGDKPAHVPGHTIDEALRLSFGPTPSFAQVDQRATRLGEVYRGAGVFVALLGVALLLLALLPTAFDMPHEDEMPVKGVKLVCMALMLGIVGWVRWRKLKDRWISTRLLAEELRYAPLQAATATARAGGDVQPLRAQLDALLCGGPGCQIAYNERAVHRYERIESTVKRLTYASFFIAAAAVVFALFNELQHGRWFQLTDATLRLLIFPTIFVPGAVAVLHSLIGFLRLPQLIAQHERSAARLHALRKSLPTQDLDSEEARAKVLAVGAETHGMLRRGDTTWSGIAARQEVDPA